MSKLKKVEHLLLFLTLLFLPTQLGRHFWPQFSFVYSLPIDYLSPTVYFWDILVVGVWVTFLLKKRHINRLALSFFYFFILTQSLSLFNSNIGAGLVRLEQYTAAGFFGVYVASQNFSDLKKILFWPLAIGIVGESILAITQFVKGGSLFFWILGERSFSVTTAGIAKFDFYGREFLRPYATFPHPNVLAAFLIIGTVFLIWIGDLLRNGLRNRLRNLILGATPLLAGIVVVLTASRTAISLGIILALFLLKTKGRIILLVLLMLLLPILYTRFSAVFNFDSLSLIRREQLSEKALKMWISSPILGVGLNNFIPVASDQLLVGPSRFLQPVHNIFLLALAETGVIGVIGVIILTGVPVYRLLKLYPKPYPLHPILLVWTMVIFLGLFDHYFLTLPQGYRLLFLIWGLSLSYVKT